jgi:hypothetical protein
MRWNILHPFCIKDVFALPGQAAVKYGRNGEAAQSKIIVDEFYMAKLL